MTRTMNAPALDAPASEWLVYGDALQEAGDPRGELIGLSHAVDEGRTEAAVRDAYVAQHAGALLGEAASALKAYRFDWRYCVPVRVEVRIGPDDADPVGPLLGSPVAEHLRAIRLVGVTTRKRVDLEPAMKKLAEHLPPSCKAFEFIDERASQATMLVSRDFDPDDNLVKLGPLKPFFAVAEEMKLVAADSYQLDLERIDAPHLKSFTLECLRFAEWEDANHMSGVLGAAKWPALESLSLRLVETWFANIPFETNPYVPVYSEADEDEEEDGYSRYDDEAEEGETEGVDWSVLGELLRGLHKTPLRRLALTSFESATSLLDTLAEIGLPPTVKVLVLSDSNLGDNDARAITRKPNGFRGLERLVVERTPLTAKGIAELQTIGFEVVHSPMPGEMNLPSHRYIVGQE